MRVLRRQPFPFVSTPTARRGTRLSWPTPRIFTMFDFCSRTKGQANTDAREVGMLFDSEYGLPPTSIESHTLVSPELIVVVISLRPCSSVFRLHPRLKSAGTQIKISHGDRARKLAEEKVREKNCEPKGTRCVVWSVYIDSPLAPREF